MFGGYGLMFKSVTKQMFQFIFVFFFFLLGFSLSFHVMFQQQIQGSDSFSNPWISFLKTLAMMIGDTLDFEV